MRTGFLSARRRSNTLLAAGFLVALGNGMITATPAQAQLELHGFVEVASGVRLDDGEGEVPSEWGEIPPEFLPPAYGGTRDYVLRESRVQLKGDPLWRHC